MFNRWRTLITAAAFLALPTAAMAARGIATDNVNMRAGPGTGYPVVDTIPAGAHVNIHGCLSNDSWCDVSWARDRGWVAASYLQSFYNDRYVYLPDYYNEIGIPVVTFSLGTYWGDYYTGRPWYHRRAHWAHYWREHRHPHFVRNPHHPGRNLAGHDRHRFEHNRNFGRERGMTHRSLATHDRNRGRFTDHRGRGFTGRHDHGSPHFARHGRPNFTGHNHHGGRFAAPRHVGKPHFANHGGRSHPGRSMRTFGGTAMHSHASAFGGRIGGNHIGGGIGGGHAGPAHQGGGAAPHIGGGHGGGPGRHH